jgi:hypothetical protein
VLELLLELERLAARPCRHPPLGLARDELAVALHPLTVEGRQHQLALAQVGCAVEQQDGVRAEDGLEEVRAAGGTGAQARRGRR